MIPVVECKKDKQKKCRLKKGIIFLICLSITVYIVLNWFINPVVISVSESKVKSTANSMLNETIFTILKTESYDDLITTKLDNDGKIALIQTNGIKLNLFAQTLITNAKKTLGSVNASEIEIPLGDLTKIPVFSNRGPSITVKLRSIGSLSCSIYSRFFQTGINQTKHSVYVDFSCSVNLVMPGNIKKLPVTVTMLLSEQIIIGEIPSTYLSGDNAPILSVKG